ncbi:MAG: putative inorganic carbon transporter subunit DabA, partial [Flavobacterium sp.]
MNIHLNSFDEHHVLQHLKHYLPAQNPLKDFVHHNTLHAFQDKNFFTALHEASHIFGYKTYLPLQEFRNRYLKREINSEVLKYVVQKVKGSENLENWLEKLIYTDYDESLQARVGVLRSHWKTQYAINLEKSTNSILFRLVCSYLDQGIAMWAFPVNEAGFLTS